MKHIAGFLALSLSLVAPQITRADENATLWAYQYVLVNTNDLFQVVPFIRAVRADKTLRQDVLLDYMAEVAISRQAQNKSEDYARKEIVEALGRYGGPRYEMVLRKIAADWAPSLARSSAEMFVRGSAKPTATQYIPGALDFKALREEYAAAALAAPAPSEEAARHLAEFKRGGTIDELFAWAGKPQAVSSRFPHSPVGNFERLAFYYRGLGRVVFSNLHHDGWTADAVIVDPLAFEAQMPYRENAVKHGQPDDATLAMIQLVSDTSVALRLVIDSIEEKDTATQEFMDTAAELLLAQKSAVLDERSADTYAWICQLLRRDGGPRYANVLEIVAVSTPVEHLRKHASAAVNADKNPTAPPYVPGSISIAAERAKYPSIYPNRKFTAGAL